MTGFENDASGYTGTTGLVITGTTNTTSLKGGAGNDTITYFNTAGGVLGGGAGIDALKITGSSALPTLVIDLTAPTDQTTGDQSIVTGFENVDASTYMGTTGLTITGTAGTTSIKGGTGADTITYFNAVGGVLSGGAGAGIDTLKIAGSSALPNLVIDLTAADQTKNDSTAVSTFENVDASGYTGTTGLVITGTTNTTSLKGGAGSDTIAYFNTAGGVLSGGAGAGIDTLKITGSSALPNLVIDLTVTTDQTTGDQSIVTGFENVDASTHTGSSGFTITGTAGTTSIKGGAGADIITYFDAAGGVLSGGAGTGIDTLKIANTATPLDGRMVAD